MDRPSLMEMRSSHFHKAKLGLILFACFVIYFCVKHLSVLSYNGNSYKTRPGFPTNHGNDKFCTRKTFIQKAVVFEGWEHVWEAEVVVQGLGKIMEGKLLMVPSVCLVHYNSAPSLYLCLCLPWRTQSNQGTVSGLAYATFTHSCWYLHVDGDRLFQFLLTVSRKYTVYTQALIEHHIITTRHSAMYTW